MLLEEFLDFLDTHGVEYHTTEGSVVLRRCPSCQSDKNKVWLYKDRRDDSGPLFGKCLKCEEKYNSRTYLRDIGIEQAEIDTLHGRVGGELNLSVLPALDLFGGESEEAVQEAPEPDISVFCPVGQFPEHPAAKYAIKRGWTPDQTQNILLDYMGSSVVFVVRDGGRVVGFQKRFLNPRDPSLKTLSSRGFQKRKYVLEYPNKGDICVCEGPFTALAAWHYGYHGICTFGSNVGEEQIEKIAKLAQEGRRKVAVAFDLDDSGYKGYRRVSLSLLWRDIETYRVRPERGNDLNDSWMAGSGIVRLPEDNEDVSIPGLGLSFGRGNDY